MKRFLKSISVLLFVLTFGLLVGCESIELPNGDKDNLNNDDLDSELFPENGEETNLELSFESDDDVISFGVLATASAFGDSDYIKLSANKTSSVRKLNSVEETEELDMDLINEYYQMFTSIVSSNPITITAEESDREEYENKLIYTIKDLSGEEITYTIYFNLVLIEDLEEVEKNEFDHFDDFKGHDKFDKMHDHLKDHFGHGDFPKDEKPEDLVPGGEVPEKPNTEDENVESEEETDDEVVESEDETTELQRKKKGTHGKEEGKGHGKGPHQKFDQDNDVEYAVEGLAIIDGVEYELVGSKEQDSENEDEFELSLMIKKNENDYVILEQEVEDDKQEYEMSVFENGKRKLAFEIENKENKLEINLAVSEVNEEGKTEKVTYNFKQITVNEEVIVVIKRVTADDFVKIFVKTTVDEETGEIIYDYKLEEKEFHFHKKGK